MGIAQPGPGLYVHDERVLDDLGRYVAPLGRRVLVVTGRRSDAALAGRLDRALSAHGLAYQKVVYGGECSEEEADRLAALAGPTDVVIGAGGGKVMDLGKLVAHRLGTPYVTVPTLPSNCAPTTPLAVVYTSAGEHRHTAYFPEPPRVTVVDDTLLAGSPWPYFVSGLGDTLAKPYEALASTRGEVGALGQAGITLAELAARLIRETGAAALDQIRSNQVGRAAHDLIDVILLVGGMVGGVGGEACRAAAAHAVHNGLTLLPEMHRVLHGQKVAYGLLVQQVLLGEPDEQIRALQLFYRTVELPWNWSTLAGRPALPPRELLRPVAEKAVSPRDSMRRLARPVGPDDVLAAFERIETLAATLD
ncbi:MAG: iron-containing alcohol dehydrogenase [Actinomycetia bacterium]|nr:iron-containing alcohol dehydrogenase [Actinomycetes bacterium]